LNRLLSLCLLLGIFSTSSQAIKPGQIRAHSEFYEPFRAAFTVEDIDVDQLEDIGIYLASHSTYRKHGLIRSSYLENLNFTRVKSVQNKQLVVVVTSSERNIEPRIDLLLTIKLGGSSLTHLYSLVLNPEAIGTYISSPEPQVTLVAEENTLTESEMAAEPAMTGNLTIAQAKPTTQDVTQESAAEQALQRSTILAKNQGISIIANNSPLHDDYSVYQIMRAFYLLNPQAFMRGNINRLMSGSSLIVPHPAEVATVSREQAIKFVHSVSRNQALQQPATSAQSGQ